MQFEALKSSAGKLGARRRSRKPLPTLLVFTDPRRTPDCLALARALPPGAALVFRPFGDERLLRQGPALAQVCRERQIRLLVGADPSLALALGADGVHLPERLLWRVMPIKRQQPRWLVTLAVHSAKGLMLAAQMGADAAVYSTVFPSASPSAGPPIGVIRFSRLCRLAAVPVFALGGIRPGTVMRLNHSGAAGIALMGSLGSPEPRCAD